MVHVYRILGACVSGSAHDLQMTAWHEPSSLQTAHQEGGLDTEWQYFYFKTNEMNWQK